MLSRSFFFVSMEWMLYLFSTLHLVLCPYTKVEESFNLQAIHDLLYHGTNISQYDHLEFPGVVPRTFLGPIVVATLSYPLMYIHTFFGSNKFVMQYMVRYVLAALVLCAFHKFQEGVRRHFGSIVVLWLQLITASQFHFMYYISRPLPNTFALVLALCCYHHWLMKNHRKFVFYSAAAVIIFRAELAILLGFIALGEMTSRRTSLTSIICWGVPACICMLGLTVVVDSYLWRRTVWPEGEVLWFNLFLNKSSEWGTSPWAWYFYSAIPRALMFSVFFIPFAFITDRRIRTLLIPALGFVTVYSFLPHKELRFIIYVIPLLNTAVAKTCTNLWNNRFKSLFQRVLCHITCVHLLLNISLTVLVLHISFYNYPGGFAMTSLHNIEAEENALNVHIDVYSAQTGVSRFTEQNQSWKYNKTEHLAPGEHEMMEFSHLILEWPPDNSLGSVLYINRSTHAILDVVHGYSHWEINPLAFPPIQMFLRPRILILKKAVIYHSVILNATGINSLQM